MIGVAVESTVPALLHRGAAALEAAGIEPARPEAEWLLAGLLDVERFALYVDPARRLPAAQVARYRALIERRARREPLQYLLGWEDFHGLRLAVSPDVLVPRPETEGLVEWAVEVLAGRPEPVLADLGTGSGAIACALARAIPAAEVLAVELATGALAVASRNVRELGLSARVRLLAGDLFAPLGSLSASLDLVVANPPYLPSAVIASLPPEVSRHEPRAALDGGPDGLGVIRRIVEGAPPVLKPGGWLLLEIGEEQAGPLASLMAAEGFSGIRARRDLNGVERYIGGRWETSETTLAGCASGAARREGC
ncbi:MAG: peptide chain release factor N(5)-glutamine methyltransferase [Candidatus Rokuibacteriota bacterium]